MSLIKFDKKYEIKNTAHRQAFQLVLVGTIDNLDNIKAGTPEDKIFLHQQIAEAQENACRLLHYVEGCNIDKLAKPGPRNDVVEENDN